MFIPTYRQLDENKSIVEMANKLSNGYKPSYEESEMVYAAIAYSITKFFIKLCETSTI